MKNFLSAALIAFVVAFSANCSANRYDSTPDYLFVMNLQRGKHYLNVRSLDVQKYNPPNYQIAGNFVIVGGIDRAEDEERHYQVIIRYNFDTKETFELVNGNWRKMRQGNPSSTTYSVDTRLANALFRTAYGMSFY